MGDDLDNRYHDLLFGVRRSVRYHMRRRRFFEQLDRLVSFLVVVWVTTIVYCVTVAGAEEARRLAMVAFGLVVPVAAIYLIGGSPWMRVREHARLARRFVELEQKLNRTPSEATLRYVTHMRLVIEAEEPPVMRVLDCICHNELCQAMGYDERAQIGFFQRLFAQIVDIRPDLIKVNREPAAA